MVQLHLAKVWESSTGEESLGFLIIGRAGAVTHLVQVDGEFRGVKGFAFAEVFSRGAGAR